MLRVAVPNHPQGALSEQAAEILTEAGYRSRSEPKDLTVIDPANDVDRFSRKRAAISSLT
jgi:ATP phosphoribosyltransferase